MSTVFHQPASLRGPDVDVEPWMTQDDPLLRVLSLIHLQSFSALVEDTLQAWRCK